MSDTNSGRWLSMAQASQRFSEAMVAFDWQCTHLHGAPDLRFHMLKGRLRAMTGPKRQHNDVRGGTPRGRCYWQAEIGVWSRIIVATKTRNFLEQHERPYLLPHVLEYTEAPRNAVDAMFAHLISADRVPYTDDGIAILKRAFEEVATPERVAAAHAQMTPEALAAFELNLLAHLGVISHE